ncbi:MAG: hypothetical protein IPM71_15975 [Bacteroidota bacterium]|nr:MAG: hypothetical protein IPM71_15850 [Bacteroidota bacterium]QQS51043.1 MAG: hypothetical protein IPM71_15975 [Bacteroidota bacterium]
MIVDTTFNVYSDARGGDPDSTSPTLRNYHKILWSKPLKNGTKFDLTDNKSGIYLYHSSELGEFFLGSDAITHSYKNHKRKQWLIIQIPTEVDELFNSGSTIGAYTLFPNNRIDGKHTINQARGVNSFIDDRFDLTLECIRLFYLGLQSPLYDTLLRYKYFFDLFDDFLDYIKFFLLDDLLDDKQKIRFYLPFDDFKTKPSFLNIDEYLVYKIGVINFIESRNKRIANYINLKTT